MVAGQTGTVFAKLDACPYAAEQLPLLGFKVSQRRSRSDSAYTGWDDGEEVFLSAFIDTVRWASPGVPLRNWTPASIVQNDNLFWALKFRKGTPGLASQAVNRSSAINGEQHMLAVRAMAEKGQVVMKSFRRPRLGKIQDQL